MVYFTFEHYILEVEKTLQEENVEDVRTSGTPQLSLRRQQNSQDSILNHMITFSSSNQRASMKSSNSSTNAQPSIVQMRRSTNRRGKHPPAPPKRTR